MPVPSSQSSKQAARPRTRRTESAHLQSQVRTNAASAILRLFGKPPTIDAHLHQVLEHFQGHAESEPELVLQAAVVWVVLQGLEVSCPLAIFVVWAGLLVWSFDLLLLRRLRVPALHQVNHCRFPGLRIDCSSCDKLVQLPFLGPDDIFEGSGPSKSKPLFRLTFGGSGTHNILKPCFWNYKSCPPKPEVDFLAFEGLLLDL